MATPARLELATSSLEGWRSIQLSYGVWRKLYHAFGHSEWIAISSSGQSNGLIIVPDPPKRWVFNGFKEPTRTMQAMAGILEFSLYNVCGLGN
jgi:hypothetical protein